MRSFTLCKRYFARLHNVNDSLENVPVPPISHRGYLWGYPTTKGDELSWQLGPYAHWVGLILLGAPPIQYVLYRAGATFGAQPTSGAICTQIRAFPEAVVLSHLKVH